MNNNTSTQTTAEAARAFAKEDDATDAQATAFSVFAEEYMAARPLLLLTTEALEAAADAFMDLPPAEYYRRVLDGIDRGEPAKPHADAIVPVAYSYPRRVAVYAPSAEPILVGVSLEPAPLDELVRTINALNEARAIVREAYFAVVCRQPAAVAEQALAAKTALDTLIASLDMRRYFNGDAHEFAVKKGHSREEAEAFARFVDKIEGARDE